MIAAHEALLRLRAGNARFVAGALSLDTSASQARRSPLLPLPPGVVREELAKRADQK